MLPIIKRELLSHINSSYFSFLMICSIIIFFLNGLLFTQKYEKEVDVYESTTSKFLSNKNLIYIEIIPKPNPFTYISVGNNDFRHRLYRIRHQSSIKPVNQEEYNIKIIKIPYIDWSYIIIVIYSIYTIIMSYDAISGEKKEGTLKLILSNQITRINLFVAKYLSIIISLSIPLFCGIIINLLIIIRLSPDMITRLTFLHVLLFIFISFLFLSFFILLSLLFSSIIYQSSISLLILLIIWITLIITPNISGIISEIIYDNHREINFVNQILNSDFNEYSKELRQKIENNEILSIIDLRREADHLFFKIQNNINNYYEMNINNLINKKKYFQHFACLSPISLFRFGTESIAGTGVIDEELYLKDLKEYSISFDTYTLEKINDLPIDYDFIGYSFKVPFQGKDTILTSQREVNTKIDYNYYPVFRENPKSLSMFIHNTSIFIVGLIIWNLVLAPIAMYSILKMDIR